MNDLVTVPAEPGFLRAFEEVGLIPWEPQQARQREALAEAVKAFARKVRDWELLDRAVKQQIVDQRELVEWWDEHVQKVGSGKRGPDKQPRKRG